MAESPVVVKVIPHDDYVVEAHFSSGEVKCYDMKPLIDTDPEMAILRNSTLFNQVYVNRFDHGKSIFWPGILRLSASEIYQVGWSEKLSARQYFLYQNPNDLWRAIFDDLPEHDH